MFEIPLFPLKTVLLPGNKLSLKIFEPRYLDMVARCMREDCRFGVVLIHRGEETSTDSDFHNIGTSASISDWQHREDGLLGITALGHERFEIVETYSQADGLMMATINTIAEAADITIPDQYHYMQELLTHIGAQENQSDLVTDDFVMVLYRLIYLLPLDTRFKQRLLEVPEYNDRAMILHAELIRLGIIQYVKPEASET